MTHEDPFDLLKKLEKKVSRAEKLLKENSPKEVPTESLPLLKKIAPLLHQEDFIELLEIQRALSSELDYQKLLELLLDLSLKLIQAERVFLILKEEGEKKVVLARNQDGDSLPKDWEKISRFVLDMVFDSPGILSSHQPSQDKRFLTSKSLPNLRIQALICLPLQVQENLRGALYFDRRLSSEPFSEREIALSEILSHSATLALHNAWLHRQNREKTLMIEELNSRLLEKVDSQSTALEEMEILLKRHQRELQKTHSLANLIGESPSMIKIYQLVEKIRESTLPVLIEGESGTGKELVARAIHFTSARKNLPFLSENCGALSENLLESELFGYKKGAFSGAQGEKKGLFELAGKGTLFLDEVGEMTPKMQKKLLRVLQEYEVRPLGASHPVKIEARIISATNRNLYEMVQEGKFRKDLYYRLNGVTLALPPLRDREGDVFLLARHFLKKFSEEAKRPPLKFGRGILQALSEYSWPGNIRELENELRRLIALEEKKITVKTLSKPIQNFLKTRKSPTSKRSLAAIEKAALLEALQKNRWNKAKAARELEIDRTTLYGKMEKYDLDKEEPEKE